MSGTLPRRCISLPCPSWDGHGATSPVPRERAAVGGSTGLAGISIVSFKTMASMLFMRICNDTHSFTFLGWTGNTCKFSFGTEGLNLGVGYCFAISYKAGEIKDCSVSSYCLCRQTNLPISSNQIKSINFKTNAGACPCSLLYIHTKSFVVSTALRCCVYDHHSCGGCHVIPSSTRRSTMAKGAPQRLSRRAHPPPCPFCMAVRLVVNEIVIVFGETCGS